MFTIVLLLVVVVTSVLIAIDAQNNQITLSDKPYTAMDGATGWLIDCLQLWMIGAPWYVIRRSNLMSQRRGPAAVTCRGTAAPVAPLATPAWAYCPSRNGGSYPGAKFCQWCATPLAITAAPTPTVPPPPAPPLAPPPLSQ